MRWRKSPEPAATTAEVAIAPDYAEPLRAWRLWDVEQDLDAAPRLRSLYRFSFWPVGAPLEARCEAQRFRLPRRPRHAAPTETCTCGIYGAPFELIRKKLASDYGLSSGGTALIVNNIELRMPPPTLPFFQDNISFAIFHDAGNVFTNVHDMFHSLAHWSQKNPGVCLQQATASQCDYNYISHAIGVGVRYKTPVGRVRFDFSDTI